MKLLLTTVFIIIFGYVLEANTLDWVTPVISGSSEQYKLITSLKNEDAVWLNMDIYDIISPPGIGTLGFVNGTISWHQKYYLVNDGDLIGEDLVNSGSPVFDNAVWSPTPYEMQISPNQTFMLGYWVNQDLDNPYSPTINDYYCWAELQWTGTDLVLLNSAGVSGAGGIYAGTWDVIPEPTTVVLFLLGGIAVFIKKKICFVKD